MDVPSLWLVSGLLVGSVALAGSGCSDQQDGQPPNALCTSNTDCADYICHGGICANSDPVVEGKPCLGHGDCKSYNCRGGACRSGIVKAGGECLSNVECLHGYCGPYGVCGGPGKDGGAPDLPNPDAPKSDLPKPDLPKPDLLKPDLAAPDLPQPDAQVLCGNGKLDPTEVCDGKLLGGKTCKTQGFLGGALGCRDSCTLDQRGCYNQQAIKIINSSKYGGNPLVAAGSSNFFVVYPAFHAFGVVVSHAGVLGKKIQISTNSTGACTPLVASNGPNYTVAWAPGNGTTIPCSKGYYGALVTLPNTVQYPIFNLPLGRPAAMVYDGTNYLMVGGSTAAIPVSIMSPKGKVVKTSSVPKAKVDNTGIHLAYDGTHARVVWTYQSKAMVRGRFLDQQGKAVGSEFLVEGGGRVSGGAMYNARVAYGGGKFLVVWSDTRSAGSDILGALVSATPKTTNPVVQQTIKVAVSSATKANPEVLYAGGRFLVAWLDSGTKAGSQKYVHASQVKLSGSGGQAEVVHTSAISVGPSAGWPPAMASGGGKVLLTWRTYAKSPVYKVGYTMLTFGK